MLSDEHPYSSAAFPVHPLPCVSDDGRAVVSPLKDTYDTNFHIFDFIPDSLGQDISAV